MNPVKNIEDAIQIIDSFEGNPDDFILAISDELQDPLGMNVAIITDSILAKGWEPDGFEQQEGYRIYKYKSFAGRSR
jgi:hypothetical protein